MYGSIVHCLHWLHLEPTHLAFCGEQFEAEHTILREEHICFERAQLMQWCVDRLGLCAWYGGGEQVRKRVRG
jgi:hypothetical protein